VITFHSKSKTEFMDLQASQVVFSRTEIARTDLHEAAMPKHRPMGALRNLGQQIRSRRRHLGHSRETIAQGAGISVTQLTLYESGQGHPPAFTLHRLALALDTSTSTLLGETIAENAEQVDEMMQIYAHPLVGAVIGYMRDMSKQDRQSLKIIASAFATRQRNVSNIDRAHPNQTDPVA
jgi:transcriptional regulator with XRE-family HTH domain